MKKKYKEDGSRKTYSSTKGNDNFATDFQLISISLLLKSK